MAGDDVFTALREGFGWPDLFLGLAGVLAGLGLVIWSELRSTRRA